MRSRGLIPPREIIADGKLHRCDCEGGASGKGDGAYLLFSNGHVAGGFQNWKSGEGWIAWKQEKPRELTAEQKKQISKDRAKRDADRKALADRAAKKAEAIWTFACPADPKHEYLVSKGIFHHFLRQANGLLMVPVQDCRGAWHGMQLIGKDGGKKFLTGSVVDGNYWAIGLAVNEPVCIAEGFATAASINEATRYRVIVAFDAGNLLPVAASIKRLYSDVPIIVCADDDPAQKTGKPGVGIPKATAAAKAIGGKLAIPDFGLDKRPDLTDFNDLHRLHGPWAVRECIEKAVAV